MANSRHYSWRILRLHLSLIFCIVAFGLLANWQFRRALSGNTLSWAYAVEWPLFVIYAVVLWWRLMKDELGANAEAVATAPQPSSHLRLLHLAREQKRDLRQNREDEERARYNEYLARLSREDNERQG